MAKKVYIGKEDGKSIRVNSIHIGIPTEDGTSSVAHKVLRAYIGDENNIARLCYGTPAQKTSGTGVTTWKRYEIVENTVTNYYWEKYNVNTNVTYTEELTGKSGTLSLKKNNNVYPHTNGLDTTSGTYIGTSTKVSSYIPKASAGDRFGTSSPSDVSYVFASYSGTYNVTYSNTYRVVTNTTHEKASYIGDVSSTTSDTYPSNDIFNGYWYIYKSSSTETVQDRGNLVDEVTSNDSSAYPSNGIYNGYWYVNVTNCYYGVEWDYSSSSTILTRTGNSASFSNPVPATADEPYGSSPFDDIMPWAGMKRYNIIDNKIAYSEDDYEFDVFNYETVVYIPKFYYKAEKDTANSKWRWSISPNEIDGYMLHPGSDKYVGRYLNGNFNGTHKSMSVIAPLNNISLVDGRTNSTAKGEHWHQIDYATICAIWLLYIVEYANWNSCDTLGTGNTVGVRVYNGDSDAAIYHSLNRSGYSNQYRWIENLWSNERQWIDGFVAIDRLVYLSTNNSLYNDTATNYTSSGVTLPSSSGYVKGFGYSSEFPWAFIPDTVGGSASTYLCDYVNTASGTMALYTGGNSGENDDYGLFYHGAHHVSTYTSGDVGVRLLYVP